MTVQTFSLASYKSGGDVAAATAELHWPGSIPVDKRIISEVGWVGDSALMVKEVDRAARKGSVVIFQDGHPVGQVVRTLGKDGEESDGGWIDHVRPTLGFTIVRLLIELGPKRRSCQGATGRVH